MDREAVARILKQRVKVINIGVSTFAESLKLQGVEVVEVNWTPPGGGDEEILRILEKLYR